MLDGLVVLGEEKKDGSPIVIVQQSNNMMMTTGMTPNPFLAFASPSATAATAVDIEKRQHYFSGDDDDDDDGDGGGSPNNPMDLPMMRITIPESDSVPSFPLRMDTTTFGGVGVVVPNPIMMAASSSAAAASTNTTSMMMGYCDVPSPVASPTTNTINDANNDYDNAENETKGRAIDNALVYPAWPYSPSPPQPHNGADACSVNTLASTIHAMAKVVVGSGGEKVAEVVGDMERMGNAGLEEDEDEDDEGSDFIMDEHSHGRRRRANNTIRWATSESKTTTTTTTTTTFLPNTSYDAAITTTPSAEGGANDAMMMRTTRTYCDDDQAVIFGENHLPQLVERPQDHHEHQQQQQQHQQYLHQENSPQTGRFPSPASPPPPPPPSSSSSTMVRSFSFPAVRNRPNYGGGAAYYGTINSSSGSLYSEYTTMSQSETDSPTSENCWRNGDNSSSFVAPVANIANAIAQVTSGSHDDDGGGGGREVMMVTYPDLLADSATDVVACTHVHFHKNSATASSSDPKPASSSPALQVSHPPPPTTDKRQIRLERNRESARVSRRRRKFYLEELECTVTKLSEEMDTGRMKHACDALPSLRNARAAVLNEVEEQCRAFYYPTSPNPLSTTMIKTPGTSNMLQQQQHPSIIHQLFTQQLSRTNDELKIVQIFMMQQLVSVVQPILTKFVLWLSLQNEEYYKGGRSASERLSAARIGERLLHRGTHRATPGSGMMWPLVCHEISLSYEQEEKVRTIQRSILSNVDSWIQRHTALATRNVMENIHDAISAGHAAAKSRERDVMKILTPDQRVKFLVWARRNGDVIRRLGEAKIRSGAVVSRTSWVDTGRVPTTFCGRDSRETALECGDDKYMTSPDRHVASNLYIINHLLSEIKHRQQQRKERTLSSATPTLFVHPLQLKKLSRRPSFESLVGLQAYEDSQASKKLSREASFPSTGSLKRSLNDMSLEGSHSDLHSINSSLDATNNSITPILAQSAGQAAVLAVLSDVMPIVPKAAWCNPSIMVTSTVLSSGYFVAGGEPISVGTNLPPHQNALSTVTSQPQLQAFIPAPSVTHPPKRRHAALQSPPTQQSVAAASNGKQQEQQHPPPADILDDVGDIPMPTPVSVLLRTSDDYFSLFEPHEPSSTVDYAPHHEMPHTTNTLSSRHRSAPQLATFSRWGSSPSHTSLPSAHMAVIPELEPVSVGVGVEFSSPDQMDHASYIGASMHQSAPQLYAEQPQTSLPGSLTTNSAMIPQTNDFISPGNALEEFAVMEDLPNDWAIGEGFDMDF